MNAQSYDVVVVGAGPGGTLLAYLLARSGVRTALLERHSTLDREFRGYFFQPLALRLFDQLGLLEKILQLDHWAVKAFHFVERERRLFSVDFSTLPPPYNYGLNINQPPLLQLLIDEASRFESFTFLSGTAARALLRQHEAVSGLTATRNGQTLQLNSRLVVGADGRYSAIRKAAGIAEQDEDALFDLLWTDLPLQVRETYPLQVVVQDAGMVALIPLGDQRLQLGWVIPHGTYAQVKQQGIAELRQRIGSVVPSLAPLLEQQVHDMSQFSLLAVKVATAQHWVEDGLLLIGDAAHTASPFSGQGNSLALQDAVVAHRVIIEALRAGTGSLPASLLKPFEQIRRPQVEQIMRIQRMQARMLALQHPLLRQVRQRAVPLLARLGLVNHMRNRLALGVAPLNVASEYFQVPARA